MMKRKQVDVILLEVDMARATKPSCEACDVAKGQLNKALDVVAPLLKDVGRCAHPPRLERYARESATQCFAEHRC
jgi:hypothetical protein